jgi:hypothetical protein
MFAKYDVRFRRTGDGWRISEVTVRVLPSAEDC